MIFNFQPLDPNDFVIVRLNTLQVINSSLLHLVIDQITSHFQPLHKIQATTLKGKHYTNQHLSRTDFLQLKAIFDRYKEVITNLNVGDEKAFATILQIYEEANAFEKKLNDLGTQLTATGGTSNVEIRKRQVS